jgi:hypothetical protein
LNASNVGSLAGLDFYWKIKSAKTLAQNHLKDKAMGITIMYSRCSCTLRAVNDKLLENMRKILADYQSSTKSKSCLPKTTIFKIDE